MEAVRNSASKERSVFNSNSFDNNAINENNEELGLMRKGRSMRVPGESGKVIPNGLVRFIHLQNLLDRNEFPRYPNNRNLVTCLEDIPQDSSFLVFFSHRWLRPGKMGKHPDNESNDKFKLLKEGLLKLVASQAPGLDNVYVWIDYGCIDQDAAECAELGYLDSIISYCDIIFTVVHDPEWMTWEVGDNYSDSYKNYKAKAWYDENDDEAYLNRGWCRVEMRFGAAIPLHQYQRSEKRLSKVICGLKTALTYDRRMHAIYGTRESIAALDEFPFILSPFRYGNYTAYDPVKGYLSFEEDKVKIDGLMNTLKKYERLPQFGYKGEKHPETKMRHGLGRFLFEDGSVYEGQWMNNLFHGQGRFEWANGDSHEGAFAFGKRSGLGAGKWAYGGVFEGGFLNDKKEGYGIVYASTGPIVHGTYVEDKRQGPGKIIMPGNFVIFDGDYKDDLPVICEPCQTRLLCQFVFCLCWKNCGCLSGKDANTRLQEKYNWRYLKQRLVEQYIYGKKTKKIEQIFPPLPIHPKDYNIMAEPMER